MKNEIGDELERLHAKIGRSTGMLVLMIAKRKCSPMVLCGISDNLMEAATELKALAEKNMKVS